MRPRPRPPPPAATAASATPRPPPMFRRGTPADAAAIRGMVFAERMNPLGLDPARFLVADAAGGGGGGLLAIGQLKTMGDGAYEVSSLVTAKDARGAGVGAALLAALVDSAPSPSTLYLTTITPRVPFYERAGFAVLPASAVPPSLWVEAAVGSVVARAVAGAGLVVMSKRKN